MKPSFLIICTFISLALLSGKTRVGEYYTGFGLGVVDDSNNLFEGEAFNVFVNSLASDSVDFDLQYTYSGLETNSSKETVWELGLGMRYHFDHFHDNEGMFRPFMGLGVHYLGDQLV